MGNALRFLYTNCLKPAVQEYQGYAPNGVPVGVSGLAHDIYHYEITSQVPEGLSPYVVSSKNAQANWYKKLAEAWKEARPPPTTPEEVAALVIKTLKRHQKADVEGLLAFYGLPFPNAAAAQASDLPPPSQSHEGVKFELHTLPVDTKSVSDGDTVTVYVDVADRREAASLPKDVKLAAAQRAKARAARDYPKADALQKKIVDAGYRVITGANNQDILARKYRIRLRGIDAPESSMPFGKEAKAELLRLVEGDIYSNNKFVQESLLKKGFVWHYPAYDKRPELASWEKSARAARVGLWAAANPQEPWEYRRNKRDRR